MTRHEKINPPDAIGFEQPGAAFDAAADGRLTEAEALALLKRAVQQGLDSGDPADARDPAAIKTEGRRRLALLRGQ